ncbi:MAG: poly-beta-1,6-N-acetyl-D-glucosamine biosynthesis protein PgaD [Pseudomonadota bacterium]
MSNPLIINARRQLSWNRRLFSDASTIALWAVWLWLCRSALLRVMDMAGIALGLRHATVTHATAVTHVTAAHHTTAAHAAVAHAATVTHATSVAAPLMPTGGILTFEDAVVALIGTCTLLMLWNRLSTQPSPLPRLALVPDYAGHFGIEPRQLTEARDSNVCVVHHDEAGRILRIDSAPHELPRAA